MNMIMIPFQPIIAAGETPFAMVQDSWINYPDRVFRPIHYSSVDALIASLDEKIIRLAEARFVELVKRIIDGDAGQPAPSLSARSRRCSSRPDRAAP
jgi:hypothetical protein